MKSLPIDLAHPVRYGYVSQRSVVLEKHSSANIKISRLCADRAFKLDNQLSGSLRRIFCAAGQTDIHVVALLDYLVAIAAFAF
jgi:hypothetical protein